MDLVLWETAQAIQADAESKSRFIASDAAELARQYLNGTLPPASQTVITRFLDKYGVRGVGEIDFGQPRWREEPTPVMHTLQSYLQIDPGFAPNVVFAKGEKAAQDAVEKIAAKVRKEHGGWLKEKIVRAAARRIRLLMGARESPKFFAVRTMGIARKALLEVGQEFVVAGTIERPTDLIFLNLAELESVISGMKRVIGNLLSPNAMLFTTANCAADRCRVYWSPTDAHSMKALDQRRIQTMLLPAAQFRRA